MILIEASNRQDVYLQALCQAILPDSIRSVKLRGHVPSGRCRLRITTLPIIPTCLPLQYLLVSRTNNTLHDDMNTSSFARDCVRSCRHIRPSSTKVVRPGQTLRSQARDFHTPSPLFLDFLAPSWRPTAQRTSLAASTRNAPPSRLPSSRRWLSSTPQRHAKAVQNPRKDDDGNEMHVSITPRAAHRLTAIAEQDKNPELALRVAVESGGCHGFQYLMSLVNTTDVDPTEDTLFENEESVAKEGGYKAKLVMDEPSLELLNGSSIDYTMELIGSQFKVTGIPGAKSSCGCGTSFDVA